MNAPQAHDSLYNFKVRTITGEETTLTPYRGKAILIVNVASECGFTAQYEGLEALYRKFKDKNFVILGFPCNQFGGQEPGDDSTILTFCQTRFGVSFPLFSKIDVNGDQAHPLYVYLKKQEPGLLGTEMIKWNFTKFLIDSNGKVLKRFAPQTTPAELEKAILPLLTPA